MKRFCGTVLSPFDLECLSSDYRQREKLALAMISDGRIMVANLNQQTSLLSVADKSP